LRRPPRFSSRSHRKVRQKPVVVSLGSEREQIDERGDALAQPGVVVAEQVDVGVVGRPGDAFAVGQRGGETVLGDRIEHRRHAGVVVEVGVQ